MMNGMTDIKDGFSQTMLDDFKALADEQYLGGATPPGDNDYLEPVNIPVYNSGDASHCLIGTDGDWNNTTLNDDTWEHFYVPAGDYSGTSITLTADGTDVARRTISLHNGNDIHPASLAEGDQASIRIVWDNASYWTIDRLSNMDLATQVDTIKNGSSYNIINRFNLIRYFYGFRILHGSNYNTIQNSYINHMTHEGRTDDNVAIALTTAGQGDGTTTIGTKIINNDFRNAGDAVQTVVFNDGDIINYEGTIIDSNRMWMDGDAYTDGNWAQDGYSGNDLSEFMVAENALDFKAGSENVLNPVICTNNIMWGYREGDDTTGGSHTSGAGKAITIHGGVKNLNFENNIIYDAQTLFAVNAEDPVLLDGAMSDSVIKNNIFFYAGYFNPDGDTQYPVYIYESINITIENNSFIDFDSGNFISLADSTGTNTFTANLMVGASNSTSNDGWTVSDGYMYDSPNSLGGTNNTTLPTVAEANMTDYTFEYEIFTTAPKSKTLTSVISTASSPHFGVAGSDIT